MVGSIRSLKRGEGPDEMNSEALAMGRAGWRYFWVLV